MKKESSTHRTSLHPHMPPSTKHEHRPLRSTPFPSPYPWSASGQWLQTDVVASPTLSDRRLCSQTPPPPQLLTSLEACAASPPALDVVWRFCAAAQRAATC